jgi:hypothetical protein
MVLYKQGFIERYRNYITLRNVQGLKEKNYNPVLQAIGGSRHFKVTKRRMFIELYRYLLRTRLC